MTRRKETKTPAVDPDELFNTWLDLAEEHRIHLDGDLDVEVVLAPIFAEFTGLAFLGCGTTRCVFALDDRSVIKLANDEDWSPNLFECQFWLESHEKPDVRKWLAPVIDCADDGSWLIMERTTPAEYKDVRDLVHSSRTGHEIRSFAQDWHAYFQWGRTGDGRLVLHDYGWPGGDSDALAAVKARLLR